MDAPAPVAAAHARARRLCELCRRILLIWDRHGKILTTDVITRCGVLLGAVLPVM